MIFSKLIRIAAVLRRANGERWNTGDLAVCIRANWGEAVPESPKVDDLLRVKQVCMNGLFLHFEGKPSHLCWESCAFRKVVPDNRAAVDEEWVEQLQHLRRKEPA
ncbi:hypothetical protein M527_07230 [Sphingobium indicum IP26]|uniref:Uncharacterized protein n=1 Tax=Sphingobium indicum F2 TaxID=1450518 RepID=A0A8E0WSQ8_9SPHN|nr:MULTISPECIES: hypothetical protein [Sphingobium]EPR09909.1 hypothetical protein M527_07230 [Sphingobium indicum IP26]EQB05037.1 hypothetical protein L286_09745 [Sphingobium sp. HDIP04]KER36702.1 hypothetical protein AL00_09525 [Sphingobium indicum F2]